MPELPDLTIVAEAFEAALVGRPITAATAPGPLAVRGTPGELEAFVGQRITAVVQRGKFLLVDTDRDRVVVNPMLTGRFQLARPGDKLPTKTAVVLSFGPRSAAPKRPAAWTKRAPWLPGDDASVEVRYRDPTQMGKVYLLPAGVDRAVPGLAPDELGPDADDPALTLDVWRQRIRRHPGELKNLLKNQIVHRGRRQRLQRRDPPRGAAAPVPQAVRPRAGGSRRPARGHGRDHRERDQGPSRARATNLREAGSRLPRCPRQGRHTVSALRDEDHRGEARRVRDVVLPRLPALTDGSFARAGGL